MSQTQEVDLLTTAEEKALLSMAEDVWGRLTANDIGGYSGINRPFYIKWMFKEVIEKYGHRNIGLNLTGEELKKLSAPQPTLSENREP